MTTHILPPVVEVSISNNIDIMRAGDAARRVADIQGFSPIYQGILSGVAMTLADWLSRTQETHTIEIYGVHNDEHTGVCIECKLDWLQDKPKKSIENAISVKMDGLVDEVLFEKGAKKILYLTIWLTDDRRSKFSKQETFNV